MNEYNEMIKRFERESDGIVNKNLALFQEKITEEIIKAIGDIIDNLTDKNNILPLGRNIFIGDLFSQKSSGYVNEGRMFFSLTSKILDYLNGGK